MHALLHQTAAHAQSARGGLDVEEAQLGDLVILPHQENRTDDFTAPLSDPAMLTIGVVALGKFPGYLGDEAFKVGVPAVVTAVKHAMAVNDPANVSRPMGADQPWFTHLAFRLQNLFDAAHGGKQGLL